MSEPRQRSTDQCIEMQFNELMIKVARLEEKLQASDIALNLSRESLVRWQETSNEWRQENIDQRSQYLTIEKGQAMLATESSLRYALEARTRILEQSMLEKSGRNEGMHSIWVGAIAVVTIAISIIAIFTKLK